MNNNNALLDTKSSNKGEKVYSRILPDQTILETVRSYPSGTSNILVWKNGTQTRGKSYTDPETGSVYVPMDDRFIKNNTVLLPSGTSGSSEVQEVLKAVRAFIHKYMDLDEAFEEISARYVLLTYLSERFERVPYLRVMGLYGTGKSRFLSVMHAIVFHGINLGAGLSSANIFRMLDHVKPGCLIIDELNVQDTGKNSLFVQIMNNGFQRNGTVTRCVGKEYDPRTFSAFGCKIIASHGPYADTGLESRLLTQILVGTKRKDIPRNLPSLEAWKEAEQIRNQLLNFRLHTFHSVNPEQDIPQLASMDRRVQEIVAPLWLVTGETKISAPAMEFIHAHVENLAMASRGTPEGQVAAALIALVRDENTATFREVADYIANAGWHMSAKQIGDLVRMMGFLTPKNRKGMYINLHSGDLKELATRFGIDPNYLIEAGND